MADPLKLALGVERSNALRLAGDPRGARAILERLTRLEMGDTDR